MFQTYFAPKNQPWMTSANNIQNMRIAKKNEAVIIILIKLLYPKSVIDWQLASIDSPQF